MDKFLEEYLIKNGVVPQTEAKKDSAKRDLAGKRRNILQTVIEKLKNKIY